MEKMKEPSLPSYLLTTIPLLKLAAGLVLAMAFLLALVFPVGTVHFSLLKGTCL